MCAAELTWYTLKVYNWILMKYTWWNWHAVPGTAYWNMGHTAGTLRKIGIYFILINNWHIDVPWNISKIFHFYFGYLFFSVQHMVLVLNYMIFCTVYYANCTYCELVHLIGTYIVQGFDMKLKKLFSTALIFIWDPASASMKLRMHQVIFFFDWYRILFWNFEICTISLFSFGWWYTLMKNKHQISLYLGLKKMANIL